MTGGENKKPQRAKKASCDLSETHPEKIVCQNGRERKTRRLTLHCLFTFKQKTRTGSAYSCLMRIIIEYILSSL